MLFRESTGQNPLAAFTMPSCKNRTCDSACATLIWFYTLWRMNLTKMTQLCRKLGPDLGTQKLTSATGQSPPVAFTMPSCKNRTCDSACATLIWFCSLRRMHLTKMTQLCRKLGPDLGTQSWPSQTDIIHWRHSPCRHAKTIHATWPVQLLYMILHFVKDESYQNDTALPKIGTGPGDSKLTFANGLDNPLAPFHHAVMHRRNHTCDSARASLIALTLFEGWSRTTGHRSTDKWDRTTNPANVLIFQVLDIRAASFP